MLSLRDDWFPMPEVLVGVIFYAIVIALAKFIFTTVRDSDLLNQDFGLVEILSINTLIIMKSKNALEKLIQQLKSGDADGVESELVSLNEGFLTRIRGGQYDALNTGCNNTGGCNNPSCQNNQCTNQSGSNTTCANTGCTNSGC